MAEKKKRNSRDESHKKMSRRFSGNMAPVVQSEKGKLKIGNYILGTTLGHGTFGKVKRKENYAFMFDIKILYK